MKFHKIVTVYLFLLTISCFDLFVKCSEKEKIQFNIDKLITKYEQNSKDSLQLMCAKFLKENMSDLSSEKLTFYNVKTNKEKDICLDTISSEKSLNAILAKYNLTYKTTIIPDSLFLSTDLIENNINKAIADWNRYPWNKNVPKDVFLNFLLPYKIFNENPDDWRNYFFNKYRDSISGLSSKYSFDTSNIYIKDPNELYYRIIVNEVGKWFEYKTNFRKLSQAPSLNELMCIKQGDCFQTGYLSTYILRALGIPSGIDLIPLWGSKNSGHAMEVFWDGKGKMNTPIGRSFERPSKVFRLSFKKQNLWRDSIHPFIGKDNFLLPQLQHNHWLDVTHEHTSTTNIVYHLPDTIHNIKYAYICVFNYGTWQPVFWGKVDANNNAIFSNMGCQMLYQVAIPKDGSYEILGDLFMVDSIGKKISNLLPNLSKKITMNLSKFNTGTSSFVKKGKQYELDMFNKEGQWQILSVQSCTKDSIITIKNVPSNSFYRLLETTGNRKLERIFSYTAGKQQWW